MDHWKVLKKETVFEAPPYLRVSRQRIALPDGRQIDDFYQIHLRPFAIVVPFLDDGRVLTTRQYKHGPGRVCLNFPGGFIDTGEVPQQAAAREMLEETGYQAAHWLALGDYVDNGNQLGCQGSYFLATGCRKVQAPDNNDLEDMREELHSPEALDRALWSGDFAITHGAAAWAFARLAMAQGKMPPV
ncbi:NUDIX hydrolase [Tropicibacter oceani]|uniref:GDP-mannose pyrophosphatase n=1 Tax=Tropicibacter oceani TaxID=3058420 RepID=A0ABY8QJU4_9RHOB|nr:NUDIX hydrolase [Tropicibacter oceani]WGW04283.1 NUDIX hydrolase [Tropicibacter oceani]